MKPSDRRKAMKEEMSQRLQESYNSKDDSGKFKSIYVKEKQGNTPMWKCSEDEHFIDIIPYLAGKQHPSVKEGKLAHNLDFFVHRKVGVNEDSYVCLARTYGKKCPICDEQAEIRKQDDYDEKYVKSLNPTRRALYNIVVRDNDKETRKGVQLFEVSHWLFEKELAELSKKPRGGGFILYADPDDGKTLCFRKKGNGPTNTEYKAFQFVDRDEPISDEILDAAVVLDELIHLPTYEEVKNAFFGTESDEEGTSSYVDEEKDEEPQSKKKPAKFVCPGEAGEDFGKFDECENCPDVNECEEAFNELESAKLKKAQKEVEAEAEAEETTRKRRVSEEDAEEAKTSEPAEGRRQRRRPGA